MASARMQDLSRRAVRMEEMGPMRGTDGVAGASSCAAPKLLRLKWDFACGSSLSMDVAPAMLPSVASRLSPIQIFGFPSS